VTKAGFWLNVVLGTLGIVALVSMTGVFGYKWLAIDEQNRAYACGTGKGGGLCLTGETTNMVLTFVFGGIAVILIVLTVTSVRKHWPTVQEPHGRQDSSQAFVVVHGHGVQPLSVVQWPPAESVAPPVAGAPQPSAALHLQQLEALRTAGVISDAEYQRRREHVISEI
jgi:hypothetical protein